MKTLKDVIAGVNEADIRAALYYAGRYIKQAAHFQEYGKDIFDDEQHSSPTDEVKTLALKIIAAIEDREMMPAQNFEFDCVLMILREISAIEQSLGSKFSKDDAKRAEQFLTEFNLSPPRG
jgi:hypothetical protein